MKTSATASAKDVMDFKFEKYNSTVSNDEFDSKMMLFLNDFEEVVEYKVFSSLLKVKAAMLVLLRGRNSNRGSNVAEVSRKEAENSVSEVRECWKEVRVLTRKFTRALAKVNIVTASAAVRDCRDWSRCSYLTRYVHFHHTANNQSSPHDVVKSEAKWSYSMALHRNKVLLPQDGKLVIKPLPPNAAPPTRDLGTTPVDLKLQKLNQKLTVLGVGVLTSGHIAVVHSNASNSESDTYRCQYHLTVYSSYNGKKLSRNTLSPPTNWPKMRACSVWSVTDELIMIGYYGCVGVIAVYSTAGNAVELVLDKSDIVKSVLVRVNYCAAVQCGVFVLKRRDSQHVANLARLRVHMSPGLSCKLTGQSITAPRFDWRPYACSVIVPGLVFIKDGTRNIVDLFDIDGQHVMCLDYRNSLLLLHPAELISDMLAVRTGSKVVLLFNSNSSDTFQLNEMQTTRRTCYLNEVVQRENSTALAPPVKLHCVTKLLIHRKNTDTSVFFVTENAEHVYVSDSAEAKIFRRRKCEFVASDKDGDYDYNKLPAFYQVNEQICAMCKLDDGKLLISSPSSLMLLDVTGENGKLLSQVQYTRNANYNMASLLVSLRFAFAVIGHQSTAHVRQFRGVQIVGDCFSYRESCIWTLKQRRLGKMAYSEKLRNIAISHKSEKSDKHEVSVLTEKFKVVNHLEKPTKATWNFVNVLFHNDACLVNCLQSGLISMYRYTSVSTGNFGLAYVVNADFLAMSWTSFNNPDADQTGIRLLACGADFKRDTTKTQKVLWQGTTGLHELTIIYNS